MLQNNKRIKQYKEWAKANPEIWPALMVLPFSSILAVLVWICAKIWYKRKIKLGK